MTPAVRSSSALARAGIDPTALDRALELDFLSTHPSTGGRREQVRRMAAGVTRRGAAALPDHEAWERMKRALAAPAAMGLPSP